VTATEWLVLHVVPAAEFRCGWTLPRAVGSAVVRNRLKRWLREWLRSQLASMSALDSAPATVPAAEINFRFQERPKSAKRRDLGDLKRGEFDRQLERAWADMSRRMKRQLERPQPIAAARQQPAE
jgi:hypothetical protein